MLRRVNNVKLTHQPGVFRTKGWVTLAIGRQVYRLWKVRGEEFDQLVAQTERFPWRVAQVEERAYWLFRGQWHWDNDGLHPEDVYALLVVKHQRNEATLNRAKSIVAMEQSPRSTVRRAISSEVKQFVWTRDRGRCRQCGTNTELQYDHVIPVAYGGATTAENLQILCGPCNRRKGASVV